MINSVYEVPEALQTYILQERGNPHTGTSARREVLETLRGQWASLVDNMTFGQMNDLIGIKRQANGHLATTWSADHTYDEGVLVAVPYRFVTQTLVEKFLGEYIDWLVPSYEFTSTGAIKTLIISVAENTSPLKSRAFKEVARQARTNLNGAFLSDGDDDVLKIRGSVATVQGGNHAGLMVYQLYWLLLVAKELRDNLSQLMRDALRFGRGASNEKKVVRRDTTDSFLQFASKRGEEMRTANQGKPSIENLPMPVPGAETPRTWGIEVESAGARGVDAPHHTWDRKGDGSLRSAYVEANRDPENCPDHDHDEYNGYCDWLECSRDEDGDYYDTAEFVSPPLSTADSPHLKILVEQLAREPQNDSAGVHVHVDASDLTPRNIGGLVFAYQMIEPIIEDYYKRNVRNYCRVRTPESVLATVRSSKAPDAVKHHKEQRLKKGSKIINYGDRYVSVNLQALEAHGTVEFRAMGPVYDYEHLIKWALFVREMVSIAKLNLPAKVWQAVKTWRDLERIIQRYGSEVPDYTIARMEANLQTPADELVTA